MKKTQTILILLIFFYSCQMKQSGNRENTISTSQVTDTIKINSQFSIIDSLIKYVGSDSLFKFSKCIVYVGKLGKKDFGLVTASDTTIVLYQKENNSNKWAVADTIKSAGIFEVIEQDVNGDNNDDVVITQNVTGMGGNWENVVLLFNPNTNELKHNHYYDLPNIKYDKDKKIIESAWWAGVVHCQEKMTYKISGDSLIFSSGVMFCPDGNVDGETAGIEFYKIEGEKRIVTKRIKGNSEKLWVVFHKSLWDSSDE